MKRYSPNHFPPTLKEIIIKAGRKVIISFGWGCGMDDDVCDANYDGNQFTLNDWRKILEDAELWEKASSEFMAFVLSGK